MDDTMEKDALKFKEIQGQMKTKVGLLVMCIMRARCCIALFAKTIQGASSSDVNPPVCNRRCREALVIQLVHGEYLPIAGGLQHRHRTALADQENLVVGGNRRREVLVDRTMQAALLNHIAG